MANILDNPYIMETLTQDSGYTEKRIPANLRDEADYILIQRELGQEAISSAVEIGLGDDGRVIAEVDEAGSDGNEYTLEVEVDDSNDASLSASIDGTDVTVTLGTDSNGDPDDTKNTADDVATELDDLDDINAEASGDGSDAIDDGDVGVYGFKGGMDAVADLDFVKDYQIIKTPNDDLFNHIADYQKWLVDNEIDYDSEDGDFFEDKTKVLAINLNGKWYRNY